MDLWQLHIYCKVVEQKSFSGASKAVHLSQPTISSHIKDLEEHFGCRLIDRLSKESLPTKAGEILYRYARRLLALRDETEAALAELQGKIKGRLVIGGSTIPGVYILPRIIGGFMESYPEVTVCLVNGDSESVIGGILSGSLELGVVGAAVRDKKIVQHKLLDDELRLVVTRDHKWADEASIELERLFEEPFISREPGSGTLKNIERSLNEKGFGLTDLKIIAEMGSTEAVIQGIKGNVGVSILSPVAIADDLKSGRLAALPVVGLDLRRSFYLSTHKYRGESPLGHLFSQFLKDTAKNIFPALPEQL